MKAFLRSIVSVALALLGTSATFGQSGWTVERLYGPLQTAEGPVWTAGGKLFFTEMEASRVHRYDFAANRPEVVMADSGTAIGMALDAEQRLVICEARRRRLTRQEADKSFTILWEASQQGGGPNDVVLSKAGHAYFTVPKENRVYRRAADGKVSVVAEGIDFPNGVMLSKDEATLFVTEFRKRKVHAYPLQDEAGIVGEGRVFAQIETEGEEHGADGMAVDDAGNLYVTCLNGVWVYNRHGKEVAHLPLPGERVTNCTFAPGDDNKLVITTRAAIYLATRK